MQKLSFLLLSILLSVVFTTNAYSKAYPKTFSPAPECRTKVTPLEIMQMIKSMYPEVTEDEICECFPCLCCECGDRLVIKKTPNNELCPPNKLVTKICCPEVFPPKTVSWYCCEDVEPPCPDDCCEPCDVDKCPAPYQKFYIRFRFSDGSQFNIGNRQLAYDIINKYGKQCCEEYINSDWSGHLCPTMPEMVITVCIHPNELNNLLNDWNGLGSQYIAYPVGDIGVPCICGGK